MFFPTYDITYDLKQASYPKEPYVSFLDHILISNSLVQNKNYSVKTLPFDDYMGSFNVYEQYISDHMPVLLSIYWLIYFYYYYKIINFKYEKNTFNNIYI